MRIYLGRYTPVCVEKLAPGLIRLLATGGPSSSRYTVNTHGVTMSVPRHNSSALLDRAVIVRENGYHNKEVQNEGHNCGSNRKRVVFPTHSRLHLCNLRDGGVI
jgi:hypothetical protein